VKGFSFSAVPLLDGQQEGHSACKKAGCWFVDGDDMTGLLHVLQLQMSPVTTTSIIIDKFNSGCLADKRHQATG